MADGPDRAAEFECEEASAIRAFQGGMGSARPGLGWDGMGRDGKGLMMMMMVEKMMPSADVSSWTGAGRKGGNFFFFFSSSKDDWKNEAVRTKSGIFFLCLFFV